MHLRGFGAGIGVAGMGVAVRFGVGAGVSVSHETMPGPNAVNESSGGARVQLMFTASAALSAGLNSPTSIALSAASK